MEDLHSPKAPPAPPPPQFMALFLGHRRSLLASPGGHGSHPVFLTVQAHTPHLPLAIAPMHLTLTPWVPAPGDGGSWRCQVSCRIRGWLGGRAEDVLGRKAVASDNSHLGSQMPFPCPEPLTV